ncbi:MAG: PaaI family thioesterase [Burkholderiaceae bacterium]
MPNESPNKPKPDHLAAWIAEEERLWGHSMAEDAPAPIDRAQLAGMSGLEVMQAMLRRELPAPPIAKTLDFVVIEVAYGRAVFQGKPGYAHYNPLGSVHGGWFSTLLDSALGCSVHTMMPPGRGYTTAGLGINIVRALTAKVQRVRAEANVIHCGRQLATAEARLVGPDGTLYAHGTTTCLVFEMPATPRS